jgi:hypothetical protein
MFKQASSSTLQKVSLYTYIKNHIYRSFVGSEPIRIVVSLSCFVFPNKLERNLRGKTDVESDFFSDTCSSPGFLFGFSCAPQWQFESLDKHFLWKTEPHNRHLLTSSFS